MPYGLTNEQLAAIKTIIISYPEIQKVVLFDSCAIDSYQATADINLAISGDNLLADLSAKLKAQLKQETNIAVIFDVIDYKQITSKKLLQHIDDCGVVVCQQGNSDWVEYPLIKIAEINPREKLSKMSFATKISMDNIKSFNKKILLKSKEFYKGGVKFRNGDTLVARITPCLENGKTAFVDILEDNEVAFGSTEFIVIREKQGISDKHFLYYLAISPEFRDLAILSMTGTSGRQRVQTDTLKYYDFLTPPLLEQQAIAEVLSSLDDKIDLLHRQNKTLEDMAQTLFRQWFIEEAQDDWEEVPLTYVADIKNGFSFSSKHYIEKSNSTLEVFKMGHIDINGGLKNNPKKNFIEKEQKLERFILNKGDIVMAMTDMKDNVVILAVPAIIDKSNHYVLNQRVARIILKKDSALINNFLLYIQLKDRDNISTLQSKANSGVQVNLSTQAIKKHTIIIPPLINQQKMENIIAPIFNKVSSNQTQIQTLENLRDTLLPKLISAEVRVRY